MQTMTKNEPTNEIPQPIQWNFAIPISCFSKPDLLRIRTYSSCSNLSSASSDIQLYGPSSLAYEEYEDLNEYIESLALSRTHTIDVSDIGLQDSYDSPSDSEPNDTLEILIQKTHKIYVENSTNSDSGAPPHCTCHGESTLFDYNDVKHLSSFDIGPPLLCECDANDIQISTTQPQITQIISNTTITGKDEIKNVKIPNINPNLYKAQITQANSIDIAEEKQLNADAPEYIPCNNNNVIYNGYKPQIPWLKRCYSAPNMASYEHKSPLSTIDETEPILKIDIDLPECKQFDHDNKHKKRKKKQKYIDPFKRFRAKGNIKISHALTEDIIPNRIKYKIPNVFDYMDKSTIMQYDNQYKDDKIRILNYDFYDKNSEEMLYCVAVSFVYNSFKWKMEEILYTEKEIMDKFGINLCDIPASSRKTKAFQTHKLYTKEMENIISEHLKNAKNTKENMIWSCKWTKMEVNAEINNKQRLILAINKKEFINNVLQWIDKNGVNMLPILVFKSGKNDECDYDIEYLQIIKIETANVDIGISYNKNVQITGIYLNKNDILERHMLVSPHHNCHCLDNFVSNIDMLKIGNPDNEINQIKDLRKKWNDVKCENQTLKNKIAGLENKNKIDSGNGNGNGNGNGSDISSSASPSNVNGYYGLSTSPIQSSPSST